MHALHTLFQKRFTYLLCQRRFLFSRAKFKEFLYYIVSKYVRHETVRSANYFVEYHLFLLNCGSFKFLLNESVKQNTCIYFFLIAPYRLYVNIIQVNRDMREVYVNNECVFN